MRRREDVLFRRVDGRVVGLDLRSSRYFSINTSGAVLWDLLEHDKDAGDLVEILVRQFHRPLADAEQDVDAFTEMLRENGLLDE